MRNHFLFQGLELMDPHFLTLVILTTGKDLILIEIF